MAQHGISRPPGEILRTEPVRHDLWLQNRLTGTLTLTLSTPAGQFVSPGTGRLALTGDGPVAVVAQQAARAAGTPVLPGSGLKGAVRTHYEILSHSCDPFAWADRSRRHEERCTRRSCCEACSLFGVLGWTGRVSFSDAVPADGGSVEVRVENVPTPWAPHADKTRGDFRVYDQGESVLFDEDTRTLRPRPKDLAREVYSGTFETRMTFWNATEVELGRLLLAMGLGDGATHFELRLGGVKYDGKGAVSVAPSRLRLSGRSARILTGEDCRQRCAAWITAARASAWGRTFGRTLEDLARTLHRKD